MKFIVKRASIWDENTQPCEEAKLEKLVAIDERNVSDPSIFGSKETARTWYTDPKYFNHRTLEDGRIARDFYKNFWTVEINSLEDLMNFYDKYGAIVIDKSIWNSDYNEITIYDDYIE